MGDGTPANPIGDIDDFAFEPDDDSDLEAEIHDLGSEHQNDLVWYRNPSEYVEYMARLVQQRKKSNYPYLRPSKIMLSASLCRNCKKTIKCINDNVISRDDWLNMRAAEAAQKTV